MNMNVLYHSSVAFSEKEGYGNVMDFWKEPKVSIINW